MCLRFAGGDARLARDFDGPGREYRGRRCGVDEPGSVPDRGALGIQDGQPAAYRRLVPRWISLPALEDDHGESSTTHVEEDEHVRADASMEAMTKLPPVFSKTGTITEGN